MRWKLAVACSWLLLSVSGRALAQTPEAATRPGRRVVTPRQVLLVHPLAYYTAINGQPQGECLTARLEIGGAPAGHVRIGVYEPDVGGTTDVWRAAAWSAALVAAQLTDFDPRALQMSVEVRRSTDGPSAGALLTVGLVASIRGDQVRDDVTMTGTINPDGTIGPVGGVPLKIDGAAQAGKKVVLVPLGMETDVDPRTGSEVNLVKYGWQRGVDVRAVQDIWTAYEIFTGVALPHPTGAELPELPDEMNSLVAARIDRWIRMTKSAREKYNSWPEHTHTPWSENLIQLSRDAFDRGHAMLDEGNFTAAYMEAVSGAMYSWMAHESGRYVYSLPTQGVTALNNLPLQHEWLIKEINSTSAAMRNFHPQTFDQMAMYMNAGLVYFEGLCAFEVAEDLKLLHRSKYIQLITAGEGTPEATQEQLRQAAFAIFAGVFQIAAWVDMKLATDYLELAAQYQGTPLPAQPPLVRTADFYRRGAEANMTLVEQLSLLPAAKENEIPVDVARAVLPMGDAYYGIANVGLTRVLPRLSQYLGEGEQLDYVRLAGGMYLQSVTATLVAKYYSIGVEIGNDLMITSIKRPQALDDWIAISRRQTETSIQSLLQRNVQVATCLQLYWLARARERKTEPNDRFEALQSYFYANLMAQMLGQLARPETGPSAPTQFDDRLALPPPPIPSDDATAQSPSVPSQPATKLERPSGAPKVR